MNSEPQTNLTALHRPSYPTREEDSRESALVAGLRAGDNAAYEELLRRYERQIFGLAVRMTRNEADAEEVLQNVFLQIFRKIDTFGGDSALSTWIYSVTSNAALMLLRKRRRTREVSDHSDEQGESLSRDREPESHWSRLPQMQLESAELVDRVEAALSELPAEQYQAFILRDVEGKSAPEAAKELGVSVAALKSRLHRARLHLREVLGESEMPQIAPPVPEYEMLSGCCSGC